VAATAIRMAAIAILVLVAVAGLWWFVSDRDAAPSEQAADAGTQRVQPLDWVSFEEPEGAWGYDRISSTTTFGWLRDPSGSGDLANLEVSVEPRGVSLAEVRQDFRDRLEAQGIVTRVDEADRQIPGTDAALRLFAAGTDDDVDFAVVVLIMTVEDRVVVFVAGSSAGGPTAADLDGTVASVVIDREVFLDQLG
jgi:hypothetical protein